MTVDLASAVVRSVLLCALLQSAGAALYVALFERVLTTSARRVRAVGLVSGLVAAVALTGFYALDAARMAGEFGGAFDPELQALVVDANVAPMATRGAGLALLIGGLAATRARLVAVVGALLIAISFGTTGHSLELMPRVASGALVALHVLLGSAWFGALVPLYLAVAHEPPVPAARVVERFSSIAVWSVPPIAVAGLGLAGWLGVRASDLDRPYAQLLAVKVVAFALLMLLAAANKWRYGPRLATGNRRIVHSFRRTVALEYALIVGVLAATATLTTYFSPAD